MSIAKRPSKITLPATNNGWNNILDFLVYQFPLIKKQVWLARLDSAKIHWQSGEAVSKDSAFIASRTLCYYREVEQEPIIPFKHQVLFQNDHLVVADKPHFLPVTPGGQYVNQCLLEKLRVELQCPDIVPLHRLDKDTAGLVLFSINSESRGLYSQLFANHQIKKEYLAIAEMKSKTSTIGDQWHIKNRLVKSEPRFLMKEVSGIDNSHSEIELIKYHQYQNHGLFKLSPITGKTHQLRLHMMKIGFPILNDPFYPDLKPKSEMNFDKPLQLLAEKITFTDPISGEGVSYNTSQKLTTSIKKY